LLHCKLVDDDQDPRVSSLMQPVSDKYLQKSSDEIVSLNGVDVHKEIEERLDRVGEI
jgi:hypothetical protein